MHVCCYGLLSFSHHTVSRVPLIVLSISFYLISSNSKCFMSMFFKDPEYLFCFVYDLQKETICGIKLYVILSKMHRRIMTILYAHLICFYPLFFISHIPNFSPKSIIWCNFTLNKVIQHNYPHSHNNHS
jgi:hypothetical protein